MGHRGLAMWQRVVIFFYRDIFYRDVSIPAGDTAAPSGLRG